VASQSLSRFVLSDALDRTLALAETDLGHIQMLNRQGLLEISVQRGLGAEFLGHFHTLSTDDTSPSARSLSNRAVVAIEDVNADPSFAPHRHIAELSNFRAVCAAPLITGNGNLLGTISTHFVQPRRFAVSELQRYGRHAVQTASLIRWAQTG
jgi:GAF domain-containing protein